MYIYIYICDAPVHPLVLTWFPLLIYSV